MLKQSCWDFIQNKHHMRWMDWTRMLRFHLQHFNLYVQCKRVSNVCVCVCEPHKQIKCVFRPAGLSELQCECCITGSCWELKDPAGHQRHFLLYLRTCLVASPLDITSSHTTNMCPKQGRSASSTKRCIRGDKIPQERPGEFAGPDQRVENTHKCRKKVTELVINWRLTVQKKDILKVRDSGN